ncbi:MAG: sensor histidine kinase [Flavisolibacter sp.]
MDAYETSIYTAVLITAVLIGILILVFAWAIVRAQKRNFESRSRQFLAEIALQEEERHRIAHDLHDELGPVLAMTRLSVQRLALREPQLADALEQIERSLETVLNRMGGIARNLTPGALLQKGLEPLLDDFFELCRQAHSLPIDFRYEVKSDLRPEVSLHLFRMIQEAVYNSIKHSGARFVRVALWERKGKLLLRCEDDGRGYEASSSGNGLGLGSLRERVSLLGGKMHFVSGEEKGTSYFFEIPLKNSYGTH